MNILLLSYTMNACCVILRYNKMHVYIYIYNWMEDGRGTEKKYIKWFSIIHWTLRLN